MADKSEKPINATISIAGSEKENFDAVYAHMTTTLPGITPNNADVMRHALHLAAESVPAVEKKE